MILTTDKDFADTVKSGQKIKKQTIYYTGKLENVKQADLKIGDYVEGKGIYAGVLYDKNGENPKSLFVAMKDTTEKMDWDEAMAQDYGQYHLPNIRELTQIHLYKDAINVRLRKNGGEALKDDWYWSSTKYSAAHAWGVYFGNGARWYGNKYHTGYVRPVLAF